MHTPTVLVVDDDESFRTYMTLLLRKQGYAVEALERGAQLIVRLASEPRPGVILLDVLLPDGDGIDLMRRISRIGAAIPVIVLSGVGQVKTVVEAMKLGAVEFLMKPFDEGALITAIKDVTENARPDPRLPGADTIGEPASGLVTLNPKMRQLAEIIKRVARTDVTILIAGESGAGKEVMARHAHVHSQRKDRAFIKVNCAALPHELLESELFGYEQGAFTGAATDKPGMFELAHGGTLLLDEIGEMSSLMQAKLLHVLQDGTFMRLGGRKTIRVDVRIIAATNINIEKAVAEGKFREDLYFRLNVIRIDLPALRERREDISALCNYFIAKYRDHYTATIQELPVELLNRFLQYDWPGNVRELENSIKRFLVLPTHHSFFDNGATSNDQLDDTVPASPAAPLRLLDVAAHAAEAAEKRLVRQVLAETQGNRKLAAERMSISYKALLNKLKRWKTAPSRPVEAGVETAQTW